MCFGCAHSPVASLAERPISAGRVRELNPEARHDEAPARTIAAAQSSGGISQNLALDTDNMPVWYGSRSG